MPVIIGGGGFIGSGPRAAAMLIAPQIAIAGEAQQRQWMLFRRLRLFDHLGEITQPQFSRKSRA